MGEATKYFDVISYDHLGIVQFSVISFNFSVSRSRQVKPHTCVSTPDPLKLEL